MEKIGKLIFVFLALSLILTGINGVERIHAEDVVIKTFELLPDTEPGILDYSLELTSKSGIKKVNISSSSEVITKNYDGKKHISISGKISTSMEKLDKRLTDEVKVKILNSDYKMTNINKESYVRVYEKYNNPEINIGAVYIPFMAGKWNRCAVGEPIIGQYKTDPAEFDYNAVNRHIDQMLSAGINRLMFNFGEENEDYYRFNNFKKSELFEEINVEIFYVIAQALNRNRDIERDLNFIKKNAFNLENYNRINGRPVIYFWNAAYIPYEKNIKEGIIEEWGSLGSYIDYIRKQLTVNGTEPYMVGDFGNFGYAYNNGGLPEETINMMESFDALTCWTGRNELNKKVGWEEQFKFVEQNYEGYAKISKKYSVEFAPMVFPGFDDRENNCWGHDRYTPRSTKYFKKLLVLADKYRSINQINIATWNDWNEGHMIEPGFYQENKFGIDYLDVIKDF